MKKFFYQYEEELQNLLHKFIRMKYEKIIEAEMCNIYNIIQVVCCTTKIISLHLSIYPII